MRIEVPVIESADELEKVQPFFVEHLLWGTKQIPETYGYLGFVPSDGFYLKMVCKEKDPLRVYEKNQDPVYRDSAMEAFFQFDSEGERNASALYLNFEVNANGALRAEYGEGRIYRTYFTPEEMEKFACKTTIDEESWSMKLRLPISILEKIYGPRHLNIGSNFWCNFYKISEAAKIEHYASYAPIRTEVPSFHLPEFFATADVVEA